METTMTIGSTISKMEQVDVTLRELYASLQLMRTGAAHGRQGRAVCRGCRIRRFRSKASAQTLLKIAC